MCVWIPFHLRPLQARFSEVCLCAEHPQTGGREAGGLGRSSEGVQHQRALPDGPFYAHTNTAPDTHGSVWQSIHFFFSYFFDTKSLTVTQRRSLSLSSCRSDTPWWPSAQTVGLHLWVGSTGRPQALHGVSEQRQWRVQAASGHAHAILWLLTAPHHVCSGTLSDCDASYFYF